MRKHKETAVGVFYCQIFSDANKHLLFRGEASYVPSISNCPVPVKPTRRSRSCQRRAARSGGRGSRTPRPVGHTAHSRSLPIDLVILVYTNKKMPCWSIPRSQTVYMHFKICISYAKNGNYEAFVVVHCGQFQLNVLHLRHKHDFSFNNIDRAIYATILGG